VFANKIMKLIASAIILMWGYSIAYAADIPKDGYVPTEQVAINIAEAVLVPIVGPEVVSRERPFHAQLERGVWVVSGTAESAKVIGNTVHWVTGGPCEVRISKTTGEILLAYRQK
jgi:NTF2 fold immunity protein